MNEPNFCHGKESSLNELLHEPIIAMLMTSDGVHSDDVRALFRNIVEKNEARRRSKLRDRELFERCFTP